ncbi:hypothetical protein BBBOND_0400970 [Babesia bigemina]|uniref:Uncharacterized protein n=1 Tax=Babesia bigemina TaxID=5866 RepID=A0A061DEN8_BABBI|nr:hypothetical protein BBBOND_0400970 [Babesia bigemina]CDR97605.1 hypothetical protein BBBOND_0400970 [Babesia bigemina]|eukprot:XP_012769791.1 hypothetical protein BBBOND_0400970 [Babesia bigemina]
MPLSILRGKNVADAQCPGTLAVDPPRPKDPRRSPNFNFNPTLYYMTAYESCTALILISKA